jgi:hypothetical protein
MPLEYTHRFSASVAVVASMVKESPGPGFEAELDHGHAVNRGV